ncbi:MAG: hypothetical protein COT14_03940 [Candidatus Diapherotrites archaeon CG08_land_8_20_14_0_20_30_16]|nr:MAG: hypothetical protein COT14_03940 [Candidatus Diapherotrites archaeon CG08_land_8_20_14_0_20_30_16]
MKKGFVITLDLIIAILIVFISVTVAITFCGLHVKEKNYFPLQILAQDVSTSLEKSNVLTNTIANKTSKDLRVFVNNLPVNVCGAIIVYDAQQSTVSVEKRECYGSSDKISIYRSFVYDESIYYIRVILWYG